MKKIFFVGLLVCAAAFAVYPVSAQAPAGKDGSGYGHAPGPGQGGYGRGMMWARGWVDIPAKLPAPKNAEWLQKLKDILVVEKESLAQYKSDAGRHDVYMPYMMVIPQKENHIYWIEQLFAAYGLPPDGKVPQIVQAKSLPQAYELAVKREAGSLSRYEWLIKNAEDPNSAAALHTILIQSGWHGDMFEHALAEGSGFWYGRGPGMMGRRHEYGYGPMSIVTWVGFLIILAALIFIIIRAVRSRSERDISRETPLESLKKRYARGEIIKEQFDAMKKDLQ